jgi:hypothetical protein
LLRLLLLLLLLRPLTLPAVQLSLALSPQCCQCIKADAATEGGASHMPGEPLLLQAASTTTLAAAWALHRQMHPTVLRQQLKQA